MNQNNQPVPFGMPMPILIQSPMMGGSQGQIDNSVPARVSFALEFLSMLTFKQMTRAAVSDSLIEQIDGQKLTERENLAQNSALNLLTDYFGNKLNPNQWERLALKQARKKEVATTLLGCPICGGDRRRKNCELCKGTGNLIVRPCSNPSEEYGE